MAGVRCCVSTCETVSTIQRDLSFHKSPSDENVAEKWLKSLKDHGLMDDFFRIHSNTKICSQHFAPTCFGNYLSETLPKRKVLLRTVIPTIFIAAHRKRAYSQKSRKIQVELKKFKSLKPIELNNQVQCSQPKER